MSDAIEMIFERTPSETDSAPFPPAMKNAAFPLPTDDDLECEPDGSVEVEAIFTMIDYRDAVGNETRRRITLRGIAAGPSAPILSAICHERRAIRHFRTDRIIDFIEPDGECLSCEDFFKRVLDIDLNELTPSPSSQEARRVRDFLRAPLSVLVAAAQSDGKLDIREIDAIQSFAENEAIQLFREGRLDVFLSLSSTDYLRQLIEKMRPLQSSIKGYVRSILDYDCDRRIRFERALHKVINADDQLSNEEVGFLADVQSIRSDLDRELSELRRDGWL